MLVGEVQVVEAHRERPLGEWLATRGLGGRGHQPAEPDHGPEARLEVGQVPRQHVDLADEHRGDQEQGHQRRGRQPVVDHQDDADQGGRGEDTVQQHPGAPTDAGLDLDDVGEPAMDLAGQLGERRRT